MMQDAYTAAQLPDIRSQLVGDLSQPPGSNPALNVYALHASGGMQVPADPTVRDPGRQAQLLVDNELRRLRNAALFWVSPEMTTLCLAAAPGMPSFRPRPEDLPAPYGLIYFAAPIGGSQPWLQGTAIEFSDGRTCLHEPPASGYLVCAATWGPWDEGGRWKHGGTWFTFYTGGGTVEEMLQIHGITGGEAQRLAGQMPPLRIDNECKIPLSPADDPPGTPALEDAVRDGGSPPYWMHLVLCAFRLMATARAVRVCDQALPRPARRRAERAGVARPTAPVRLVDITAGTVRPARPAEGGAPSRTYHCRWPVTGHWRNQYFPASEVNRPIWIDDHIKGPAGAPFKARPRVNVWRKPPERLR
jgi:hypothetical protein